MNSLPKSLLPQTRVLKGQSGNYWQIGANTSQDREVFVRVKFDRMPVGLESGQMVFVDGLQINVMYVGEQFDVPEPFQPVEVRMYPDGDKKIQGVLMGKLWVPMGEFQKDLVKMYEAAHDIYSPAAQEALAPLISAASCKTTCKLSDIFEYLLSDVVSNELVKVQPEVFINQEWFDHVAKLKAASEQVYAKKEAAVAASNDKPIWPHQNENEAGPGSDTPSSGDDGSDDNGDDDHVQEP